MQFLFCIIFNFAQIKIYLLQGFLRMILRKQENTTLITFYFCANVPTFCQHLNCLVAKDM